jgi:plasmid replication initiation protein
MQKREKVLLLIDEKTAVVKSNQLIEASYKLTTQEQRIILLLASMVKRTDEDFKLYRINIKDFLDIVGIKDQGKYKEIKELTKKLVKKELTIIKEDGNPLQMTWLASADYFRGYVELEFSIKLKPYLLRLKDRYTTYQLKNVIKLKGMYSIRMYELLKASQYKGEVRYTIDELKAMLGIDPDKYTQYGHFNIKVLKPAHDEIEKKTDLRYSMTPQKKDRKIVGVWFFIQKEIAKKSKEQKEEDEIKNPELYITLKDYHGLSSKQAKEVIDLHEKQPERVNANLEYVKRQYKEKKISNIGAYTMKAIQENWKIESTLWDKEEIEEAKRQRIIQIEKEFREKLQEEYNKLIKLKSDEYQYTLTESQIEEVREQTVQKIKDKSKGSRLYGLDLMVRLDMEKHFARLGGLPDFEDWEKDQMIEFDKKIASSPELIS